MNGGPSIARELYEDIVKRPDPVAHLRDMVNSNPPTVESEYRDFKGMADNKGTPVPEGEVKKIWSEALAGFATTSGGVLLWGLDARKVPGGTVDQVVGLSLASDPNGLKSRLQQILAQATDPPIPGVLIEAYSDPSENGKGFVVCLVPESPYKPHRQEIGGKRWVMRIGESFVDVPPPVLRSLFYPHRDSYIYMEVCTVLKKHVPPDPQALHFFVRLRFVNKGPSTAKEFRVFLKPTTGPVAFNDLDGWWKQPTPQGEQFGFAHALHPGEIAELKSDRIDLSKIGFVGTLSDMPDIEFSVRMYAADQLPRSVKVVMTGPDFADQKVLRGEPQPVEMDALLV